MCVNLQHVGLVHQLPHAQSRFSFPPDVLCTQAQHFKGIALRGLRFAAVAALLVRLVQSLEQNTLELLPTTGELWTQQHSACCAA